MKWAVNKKIEKDKGHAPMDIGAVQGEGEERFSVYSENMWEGISGCQPCGTFDQSTFDESGAWVLETSWADGAYGDVSMVSKGDGKGKGKFGKAGKGPTQKWVCMPNAKGARAFPSLGECPRDRWQLAVTA